jgi:hypothetical protein
MKKLLVLLLCLCPWSFAGRTYNGTTDTISVPGIGTVIDLTTEVTLMAWIKTGSISSTEQDIVSKWGPTVGNQYELLINFPSSGNVSAGWHEAAVPGTIVNTCTTNISTPNVWHHIAAVWSVSQGFTSIFLDGGSCGTVATHGPLISNGANLILGAGDTGTRLPFVGTMAEVCIYNVILSTPEIGTAAHGTPCSKLHTTALAGYWQMTGAKLIAEPDASGHLNGGTVTGTTLGSHCPCIKPN